MFRDENGKLSSTRFVLVTVTIMFCIAMAADIFTDVTVDGQIYNIVQTIIGVGLGGHAIRTGIKNYKKPGDN